jgi:hypothetical protein
MSSSIASFFSSFISTTTYADAEEQSPADAEVTVVEQEKEEEEEEPEDVRGSMFRCESGGVRELITRRA